MASDRPPGGACGAAFDARPAPGLERPPGGASAPAGALEGPPAGGRPPERPPAGGAAGGRRLRRRRAADRAFAALGATVALGAAAVVALLFAAIAHRALPAATATDVVVRAHFDPALVPPGDPRAGDFRAVLARAGAALAPPGATEAERALHASLLSEGGTRALREAAAAEPSPVGSTIEIALPAADALDQYRKGLLRPEPGSSLSPEAAAAFEALRARGLVRVRPAWELLRNADSRFPELAGIAGAARGSLLALLVCLLLAVPAGVAAALWFEEFAPRGRMRLLFQANVQNLAAVPSIVFGLLGLAVFLNLLGLPRSSPLVGGLVLGLMTLPVVIVVSSAALRAAPPGPREAALALGASRQEAAFHHVLPAAAPGIVTGVLIGLARALGETAPLLLIGMNAFVPSSGGGLADPSSALPAQIFIWADQPERGFAPRTAAAVLALLLVLAAANLAAALLRARFERRGR